MEIFFTGLFKKQLATVRKRGGESKTVAEQVDAIVGRIAQSENGPAAAFGSLTHHGESRIDHCVKYDLHGRHRLVCIVNDRLFQLLYVGNHGEVDTWLENNRGYTISVSRRSHRATPIKEMAFEELSARGTLPCELQPVVAPANEELLTPELRAALLAAGLHHDHLLRLDRCTRFSEDDELLDAASVPADEAQQNLLISVVIALRDGHDAAALALVEKFDGMADDLSSLPAETVHDVLHAPANTDVFFPLRDLSADEVTKALGGEDFHEWLLFLHPDQAPIVNFSGKRTFSLGGVPGSGKTSVLVHRARTLARRYPEERILIVALNPALASLLSKLVKLLCTSVEARRIDVLSVDDLCRRITFQFDPARRLLIRDERSEETLEDCWTETWTSEDTQQRLQPLVRSLENQGVDASRYLRDEMIWVRSAFARPLDGDAGSKLLGRRSYEDPERAPRRGRQIAFSADWRVRLLGALQTYEEYCEHGSLHDSAAVTLLAHQWISRLREERPQSLRYRAVLVDESQDLGTVELEILNALAPEAEDAFFLAGDPEQQVFPKAHDLAAAGIKLDHRRAFKRNFRNPRQILEAAVALAQQFAGDTEAEERLQPEFAARESSQPLACQFPDEGAEIAQVAGVLQQRLAILPHTVMCVVACGIRDDDEQALVQLAERYRAAGLVVRLLRSDSSLESGVVFVSSLETIKGFEFSTVVVTRCTHDQMPVQSLPAAEAWRDARRLYVAFTRARDELILTWSGLPSRFITGIAHVLSFQPLLQPGIELEVESGAKGDDFASTLRKTHQQAPTVSKEASVSAAAAMLPSPSPASLSALLPSSVAGAAARGAPTSVAMPSSPVAQPARLEDRISALQLEVIDKRRQGGALWVVGGRELELPLRRLCDGGDQFLFAANGSRGTGRRPAWWLAKRT